MIDSRSLKKLRKDTQFSIQSQNKNYNRRQWKEKCKQIRNEIDFDLQKLENLLKKTKTTKHNLVSVVELAGDHNSQQNSEDQQYAQTKQRRLKFKYSVQREYQFMENKQGQKKQIQSSTKDISMNLLKKKFTQIDKAESIDIETRYNWIQKYLNSDLNDVVIKGKNADDQIIEIIRFLKNENSFEVKIFNQNAQQLTMVDSTNKIASQNLSLKQKTSPKQVCPKLNYSSLLQLNTSLSIEFPKHMSQMCLLQPSQQRNQVIRLKVSQNCEKLRIILKNINTEGQHMQRIMIFKQLPSNQANGRYNIVWTRYDKEGFVEDLILEKGQTYLITNMTSNPTSQLYLLLNQYDIQDLQIQKASYDPWRSYNILCSSFQQCTKVFIQENVFDSSKPLQFFRANFLDHGIILEIYQNIYQQKIAFLQKQQNQSKVEDKALLFSEIYTKLQNFNAYLPHELVIKFYQVTEKPARLYFPKKTILVGQKMAQHTTIYSTFK